MSNATAIDPEERELLYTETFDPDGTFMGRRRMVMTPRQARRYWHKLNRAYGGFEPVYEDTPAAERPKGCPTPRRSDAVRGRRALRQSAEARRGASASPGEVAAR